MIVEWLRSESKPLAKDLSRDVEYELRRCFSSSLSQLRRRGHPTDRGAFEISIRDESTGLAWDIRCQDDDLVTDAWAPDLSRASTRLSTSRLPPSNAILDNPDFLVRVLMTEYSQFLLRGYSAPSHYMPASRSGVLQGHKTVANLGLQEIGWIGGSAVDTGGVEIKTAEVKVDGVAEALAVTKAAR